MFNVGAQGIAAVYDVVALICKLGHYISCIVHPIPVIAQSPDHNVDSGTAIQVEFQKLLRRDAHSSRYTRYGVAGLGGVGDLPPIN